jgi:hypothetical protein
MSAAARAASVAPWTAMPTSARCVFVFLVFWFLCWGGGLFVVGGAGFCLMGGGCCWGVVFLGGEQRRQWEERKENEKHKQVPYAAVLFFSSFLSLSLFSHLERGRVVDAVARHAARKSFLPQRLDDQVLVLGEHAREPVGLDDHAPVLLPEVLGDLAVLAERGQARGVGDVGAEAELAGRLFRDDGVIARDHLFFVVLFGLLCGMVLGVLGWCWGCFGGKRKRVFFGGVSGVVVVFSWADDRR